MAVKAPPDELARKVSLSFTRPAYTCVWIFVIIAPPSASITAKTYIFNILSIDLFSYSFFPGDKFQIYLNNYVLI